MWKPGFCSFKFPEALAPGEISEKPRMFTAWCLSTEGFEKMLAVRVDTPSFRCLCLGAWYQERREKKAGMLFKGWFVQVELG